MKLTRILPVAIIGVLGLAACNNSKEHSSQSVDPNMKFESYTFDIIGELSDADSIFPGDSTARYIRYMAQGILPESVGDSDISVLRDSLLNMARIEYSEDEQILPVTSAAYTLTDLSPKTTDACGYVYSTLAATLVTPKVVVWECTRSSYACRAAHGNSGTQFINYSIVDNRILSLDDIMKPGYQKKLVKLLRKQLKQDNTPLICSLDEVEIPSQFEISATGLKFSWDPYEIAPYSEGVVKVSFSLTDLYDLLNAKGLNLYSVAIK